MANPNLARGHHETCEISEGEGQIAPCTCGFLGGVIWERERLEPIALRIQDSISAIAEWATSGSLETAILKRELSKLNALSGEICALGEAARKAI